MRVLIVEDNQGDAELVTLRLSEMPDEPSEITRASSLAQASALLRESPPFGIVVVDLDLPDSRGLHTLRALRAIEARVPIVVVTGTATAPLRREAIAQGAEELLSKDELGSRLFARSIYSVIQRDRAIREHEKLDAVLACAPAFVVTVDPEGRIQFINRVLPQYRREDVLSSTWDRFVVPEHRSVTRRALHDVITTGCQRSVDVRIIEPTGQLVHMRCHIGPIRHGATITGAVVVASDITDSVRAEADLMAAQRLAAVGSLAAGVAHEINTPIQFVTDSVHFLKDAMADLLGYLEAVTDAHAGLVEGRLSPIETQAACAAAAEASDIQYLRENAPAALGRCVDGLRRVATIVRSLKEFSHPGAREMQASDLNRAVRTTLTLSVNEYKYWADLETGFDEELPPVECRIDEIGQVVLNLVVNAAHTIQSVVGTTGARGKIRVATRRDGAFAVISIADTGTGIPEAIRGRIFDPFFTTKEVGKGTGQGLAIANTLIRERHQGELWFDTELGRGTTFFIRIPIVAAAAANRDEAPVPASAPVERSAGVAGG